jgi:hypothetical protein
MCVTVRGISRHIKCLDSAQQNEMMTNLTILFFILYSNCEGSGGRVWGLSLSFTTAFISKQVLQWQQPKCRFTFKLKARLKAKWFRIESQITIHPTPSGGRVWGLSLNFTTAFTSSQAVTAQSCDRNGTSRAPLITWAAATHSQSGMCPLLPSGPGQKWDQK